MTGGQPKPLNVGVIGFGKMGLLHAGILSGMAGARLVAIADPSSVLLGAVEQQNPNVHIHEQYERMLDAEQLDAVFITAPSFLHVPICTACIERGLPFFVEKPLATTAAEAGPMMDAYRRKPVATAVGYMSRYLDSFAKAKQLLDTGALGRPIHVAATMYCTQLFAKGKGWRYDKKLSGGGVLITQNSHLVDLLLWYFGPAVRVSGRTKSFYSKTIDEFAHAQFEFESGLSGYFDASWSVRHHRMVDIWIELHAENGTLTVTDDTVKLFLDRGTGKLPAGWSQWRGPDLFTGVEVDVGGPQYTRQDAAFLNAVRTGDGGGCDIEDAFSVQRFIDAVYASSETGGSPVELREIS